MVAREEDVVQSRQGLSKPNSFLLGSILGIFLLFLISYILFGAAGRDDPYITYWPSHTLASQGSIENYNGKPLEQSSSLLHVLLLASVSYLTHLNPHQVGWIFALVCGLAVVPLTCAIARKINPGSELSAGILVALYPPLTYWVVSELEGPLTALTLCLLVLAWAGFIRSGRYFLWMGGATLLYSLVRPEAAIVAFVAVLGLICCFPKEKRVIGILATVIFLAAGIALTRYLWSGYAAPLPVYAKSGLDPARLVEGLHYIQFAIPFLIGILVLPRIARSSTEGAIIMCFSFAILLFVVVVGGDWMEGWRFLVPLAPFAAVGAAMFSKPGQVLTAIISLCVLFYIAAYKSTGTPLWARKELPSASRYTWPEHVNRVHARDHKTTEALESVVNTMLTRKLQVSIMSSQMGFVCYHTKLKFGDNIRLIDRKGLCDNLLTDLGISKDAKRNYGGRDVSYSHALNLLPKYERPDIIFDLGQGGRMNMVQEAGYFVIFEDNGTLTSGANILEGFPVEKHQFIAVSPELAPIFMHPR